MTTTTPGRHLVTTPPPSRRAAVDTPEPPAIPDGATPSLTVVGVEATYYVYPDQTRGQHVVVGVRPSYAPVRLTEYPWDSWGLAARYVVGVAENQLRATGRLGAPTAYCGDCGAVCQRGADGVAECPTHGRP